MKSPLGVIHSSSRRADGRWLDWVLHANPKLDERAMLVVFNPTDRVVSAELPLDLYYTGLTNGARVTQGPAKAESGIVLDARGRVRWPVEVPARGVAWYVFGESR